MLTALKMASARLGVAKNNTIVEIESRIKLESTKKLIHYVKTLKESDVQFRIERRIDIAGDSHIIRVVYDGQNNKPIGKYHIVKERMIDNQLQPDGSIITARFETTNPYDSSIPIDTTKAKGSIKFRAIAESSGWQIDFVAQYDTVNHDDLRIRQELYFRHQIKDIDAFVDFMSKNILPFNYCYIELEALNLQQNENDSDLEERNLRYNDIYQTIFCDDIHSHLYNRIINDIANQFLPVYAKRHSFGSSYKTLKNITPGVETLNLDMLGDPDFFPFNGWHVTDKADGVHAMFYMDTKGGIYLVEEEIHAIVESIPVKSFYGGYWGANESTDQIIVIEGEYVTKDHKGNQISLFLAFDLIYAYGVSYTDYSLDERLSKLPDVLKDMQKHLDKVDKNQPIPRYAKKTKKQVTLRMKEFQKLVVGPNGDMTQYNATIDHYVAQMKQKEYETDGLIFAKPDTFLKTKWIKWKPTSNTIDFLVMKVPNEVSGHPPYEIREGYTCYILFVTIGIVQKNNQKIENLKFYTTLFPNSNYDRPEQPIHFVTSIAHNAHIHYDKNATLHGQIVEFMPAFKDNKVTYTLQRIRTDRKIDFEAGKYFGNNWKVAELNLLVARNPITADQLKGQFDAGYFVTVKGEMHKSMTRYNNGVKSILWETHYKNKNWVIDLAAGRGSDILNYVNNINQAVIAVEVDIRAIHTLITRKHQIINGRSGKQNNVMPFIYAVPHDLNSPYTETLDLILMFNPPSEIVSGNKRHISLDGAVCHFAIHYLVSPTGNTTNFVKLIRGLLPVGGKFTFTCFDSKKVNELLDQNKGHWIVMQDHLVKYRIRRDNGKIKLILPFTNGQEIEETLFSIDQLMTEFGLNGIGLYEQKNFLDYSSHLNIDGLTMDDIKFIGLYTAITVIVNK